MEGTLENLSVIVAMTNDRVIGKDNRIPWHIPDDLRLFRSLTEGNTVLMGRNTYLSIGHPLKNRNNIVVSRSMPETEGIVVARSLESALEVAKTLGKPIFCAGGASIYRQTLPLARHLYISYVNEKYEGNIFFPEFDPDNYIIEERKDYPEFEFVRYEKII